MEPTGYHHFHLRDLESEHGTPLLRLELCRPNPVPPPITSVNAVEADKQIQAYDDLFDSIVHRGYIVAHDATFQRIQRLVELTTVFGAFQAVTCTVSLYLQKWFTCSEKSDIGRLVSVLNMAMLFRSRVFFREAFIHLVGIWDERYNTNELDLKGEVRALISRKALLLQNQCLDVSLTLNRIIMNKESLTESQYQQIIEALESFGYNWNEVTYYKELSRINFSSLLDRELGYQCQELAKNNLFFCDPQAQLRGHLVCTILEDEEFPVGLRPSEDSW